jgi:hypothetical protein
MIKGIAKSIFISQFSVLTLQLASITKTLGDKGYLCSASIEAIENKFLNDSCEVEQGNAGTN